MEIRINSLSDIPEAARTFLKKIGSHKVITFSAGMGVGKTTFISEICRQAGIEDEPSSPTFAIVNEYSIKNSDRKIFHFDCYRLEELEEAMDMGTEDYLYSGNLCLIEWPDIIAPLLPEDTLEVNIHEEPDGSRTVSFMP
ncbi:MAG: tRNA (adenosine(37)-N6)-threonylcarbamoyltransferase complex ATPase subunit type 1 TsaE [Muribaculaceae bacterium]|nr:tRNA (adenosine(37)-N6)-threonylcarbamoyltransferase complex ATPase subunit type 1 TsaE [Muribaculaceae bacterium]